MSDSERGIGFQPVNSRMTGWKPIPLIFRLILKHNTELNVKTGRGSFGKLPDPSWTLPLCFSFTAFAVRFKIECTRAFLLPHSLLLTPYHGRACHCVACVLALAGVAERWLGPLITCTARVEP